MIDLLIVLGYFTVIMMAALSGRQKGKLLTADQYFLNSRNLRWPSIALSTIATNIHGYQFLGMMGSAYLYGLAQASLEINAIQGILIAAFIFVPLYLRDKVTTITQFISKRLGKKVGLAYSIANLTLFSTLTLGSALFWGAYAAEMVFTDYLELLHEDRLVRTSMLVIVLGIFSAIYTYLGGLGAVVRTDIIQFIILLGGGIAVLAVSLDQLGGWSALYEKTPDLMHLHLPADHEKLPWIHIFGLFLLNINYWCANQTVMQRSLAAKNLREAQVGLMVGGLTKYLMALVVVVPGIALAGIMGDDGLSDPDMTFPHLVSNFLPWGLKGLILCALFASLMSTVDSTFNSLATLWSIDIYKEYLRKDASDQQVIGAGKQAILVSLFSGIFMGIVLLHLKFADEKSAFTHNLNELRYYVNCGIVLLICTAGFIWVPRYKRVLAAFLLTVPLNLFLQWYFPDMNYFVRAMWVIVLAFSIQLPGMKWSDWRPGREIIQSAGPQISRFGWVLLASLILTHILFH